jgi:tRNA uridine 5-carboxymethylaminomethyl modification enzyme
MTALEFLGRPDGSYGEVRRADPGARLCEEWAACLEVRLRYRGYIERQARVAARAAALDAMSLPDVLWESDLLGVSREAGEKLRRMKPATVAQAGRIAGVSPADVSVLLVLARRAAR